MFVGIASLPESADPLSQPLLKMPRLIGLDDLAHAQALLPRGGCRSRVNIWHLQDPQRARHDKARPSATRIPSLGCRRHTTHKEGQVTNSDATTEPSLAGVAPLCVRRGSRWLTEDELCAHLAASVRLENVGVLLGAGASVGALGGKTMSGLWQDFAAVHKESYDKLVEQKFVAHEETPDVEKLADTLDIALSELVRQERSEPARELRVIKADLQRAVIRASLLQDPWWSDPDRVMAPEGQLLSSHRILLQRLVASRQPGQPSPWVFTTNYDLAIEWSAESVGLKVTNGFDGLHRRTFAPQNFDLAYRNAAARGEARFGPYGINLVKLHGSLTWRTTSDGEYRELPTELAWNAIDPFLRSNGDEGYSGPMIFPSAAKYMSTVGFVLGELFRRCADFLSHPHTFLITNGYSFSDEHLNRLLASALQNPTLQLLICVPEARRVGDELQLRQSSGWVRRIVALESPQVTIVGDGANAYLEALVARLPEPVVFDEQAARILEALRDLKRAQSGDAE